MIVDERLANSNKLIAYEGDVKPQLIISGQQLNNNLGEIKYDPSTWYIGTCEEDMQPHEYAVLVPKHKRWK